MASMASIEPTNPLRQASEWPASPAQAKCSLPRGPKIPKPTDLSCFPPFPLPPAPPRPSYPFLAVCCSLLHPSSFIHLALHLALLAHCSLIPTRSSQSSCPHFILRPPTSNPRFSFPSSFSPPALLPSRLLAFSPSRPLALPPLLGQASLTRHTGTPQTSIRGKSPLSQFEPAPQKPPVTAHNSSGRASHTASLQRHLGHPVWRPVRR